MLCEYEGANFKPSPTNDDVNETTTGTMTACVESNFLFTRSLKSIKDLVSGHDY